MEEPTIDNTKYHKKMAHKWIFPPQEWAKEQGAIVAMPGGMSCPWCNAECIMKEDSMIAVCVKDEKHIVQWCPWGA